MGLFKNFVNGYESVRYFTWLHTINPALLFASRTLALSEKLPDWSSNGSYIRVSRQTSYFLRLNVARDETQIRHYTPESKLGPCISKLDAKIREKSEKQTIFHQNNAPAHKSDG